MYAFYVLTGDHDGRMKWYEIPHASTTGVNCECHIDIWDYDVRLHSITSVIDTIFKFSKFNIIGNGGKIGCDITTGVSTSWQGDVGTNYDVHRRPAHLPLPLNSHDVVTMNYKLIKNLDVFVDFVSTTFLVFNFIIGH